MSQVRRHRRIQVSFIGSAKLEEGSEEGRPLYRKANYCFRKSNGKERYIETSFFPLALGAHLSDEKTTVDCLLLIGTPQSNWDVLSHAIPAEKRDCVADWVKGASNIDDGERVVNEAALYDVPRAILEHLHYGELRCEVVPTATDLPGQCAFMNAILKHMKPGDQIILDVTHGLRHMPVMAAFLVNALRWLYDDIRVSDMYYGALELTPKGGPTPVVNLRIAADYAKMGAAMAVFHTTGSYRELASHFPEQKASMERADFLEGIHQLDRVQKDAQALHTFFQGRREPNEDPYLNAVADRIKDEWQWAETKTPEHHMLKQARRFLTHGEYLKCASILQEVFFIHIEHLQPDADHRNAQGRTAYLKKYMIALGVREGLSKGKAEERFVRFHRLGQLRNKFMHYRPEDENAERLHTSVSEALGSRTKMEGLLDDGIKLAEWLLEATAKGEVAFDKDDAAIR